MVARGRLVEKGYLPVATVDENGAISQGTGGGNQWVLEEPSWELEVGPEAPGVTAAPPSTSNP